MPINRWGGVTINRVNFREGPGTSHGIIVEFKQNALLYIYTQETVDGTPGIRVYSTEEQVTSWRSMCAC